MEKFLDAEFEKTMPQVLQADRTMGIMGKLIGTQLRDLNEEMAKEIIWARIDELDEETLDILAYDLHVDWWQYASTIESKRANLKNAVEVHRIMGTKAACELAAEMCVGGKVTIQEWFEYQGEPGYFRIIVHETERVDYDELVAIIFKVKRCSSWLEGFVQERESTAMVQAAVMTQSAIFVESWTQDNNVPVLTAQLTLDPEYEIGITGPNEQDGEVRDVTILTGFDMA